MRILLLFISCVVSLTVSAADRPKAPAGFSWKTYDDLYCDIQVPAGWTAAKSNAGLTKVVRISPKPINKGEGMAIGFTMNTLKAKTQKQWEEGMRLVGEIMSATREATPEPIQSSIKDEKGMLLMIIEGERFIPDAPHPEKKYHVRTIVRAFTDYATIYIYSFGAPVEEWDEAWKTGTVMLNPIWFKLRK